MKPVKLVFYLALALLSIAVAFYILAREPLPGWPINLIHLLFVH
jgi:hypothetical protein